MRSPLASRRCVRLAPALAAFALAASVSLSPADARADREHTVRSGQTLSGIARRYGVRVSSLAAANRLSRGSNLRPGQVLRVPEQGVTYVRPGQTLSAIARANDTTPAEICRLNRIRPTSTLRVGQRLILPGFVAAREREQAAERWGRPRHPGVAKLIRIHPRERQRVRLVSSRNRRPTNAARRVLRRFMRDGVSGPTHNPHPRLVQVLARISDHFGGRPLVIVSGFRRPGGYTRETSKHTEGRAVDIRIVGVSNRHLRDYCRDLPRVGCGYYPNSTFVHVDVRDRSAYWVDYSRPGEPPRYRRRRGGDGGEATARADEAGEAAVAEPTVDDDAPVRELPADEDETEAAPEPAAGAADEVADEGSG